MACLEREMIENHDIYAREICDFLYIDGKGKKGFQNHTEEEYRAFLKEMSDRLFDDYNRAARAMGWLD